MEDQEMRMVSIPKKVWKVVRVFLYMLRKGLCKKKLLLDLNLLLKRGKLAGKAALVNLTFFHHPTTTSAANAEYEFSCSNTPAHRNFLMSHVMHAAAGGKKKGGRKGLGGGGGPVKYGCIEEEMAALNSAIHMVMASGAAVEASPVLPGLGFGRSPLVRQLRVTDSPFPMSASEGGDCHVDEAAEEFIKRFYSQLRTQSFTDS